MIKMVGIFLLKEGKDPEKVWKDWEETHASYYKNMPGLRKYIINRATQARTGNPRFWGLAEFWFDKEEDLSKAFQNRPKDNFIDNFADFFSTFVEEKVIVERNG
jgi:uncharacterized protein (TIGR02118 family)